MSFVSLGIVPAGAIPAYAAYCAALLSRASEFPSATAANLRHRAAKLPSQAGLILALALRRKRMFSGHEPFGLPSDIGERWMLHMRRGEFAAAWQLSDIVLGARATRRCKDLRAIYNGFGTAALWSAST